MKAVLAGHILFSLTLIALSCATFHETENEVINQISIYSTPGKLVHLCIEWKPARQTTVMRYSNRYYLVVSKNVFEDSANCYREAREVLTQSEFDSTIAIVFKQRLIDFVPVYGNDLAYDYSTLGLSIVGRQGNQQEWDRPLLNESALTPLVMYLDHLVKIKLPAWAD